MNAYSDVRAHHHELSATFGALPAATVGGVNASEGKHAVPHAADGPAASAACALRTVARSSAGDSMAAGVGCQLAGLTPPSSKIIY